MLVVFIPMQAYLVDFGLAHRYMPDGKHKEYKEDPRKAHDGTAEFTSRDAHKGVGRLKQVMQAFGWAVI